MARARGAAARAGAAGAAAAGGRGGLRGYLAGAVREIFAPMHPREEVRFAEQAYAGDAMPHESRRLQKLWDHVQAYVEDQDEVLGGDAPLGVRATELQDLREGLMELQDEKLQGWMEGAVAQVFAKKGSGEEFQVQPIAPKEEIANRDQIRKLRRFQGHLRDHDRVM